MKRLIKIFTTVLFILFIVVGLALTCDHGGFGNGHGGHGNNDNGSQGDNDSNNGSGGDISGNSTQGISPPSPPAPSSPGIGISSIGNSSSASPNVDLGSSDVDADIPNSAPTMLDIILAKNDCWIITNGWCVNVIEPGLWRAEKNGKVVIYQKVKK